MLMNYLTSLIRTIVPAAVASGITWLSVRYGIILDENTSTQLSAIATGIVLALYYITIRTLETRWSWFGVFLGAKNQPEYVKTYAGAIESRHEN